MDNIYTTSATMNYMLRRENLSMDKISELLNEDIELVRLYLKGSRRFTKSNYLSIIAEYPYFEGRIEYYENVKLKDIK